MLSSPLVLLHLTALTHTVSAFFSISPKRPRSFRVRADPRPPLLLSNTSSAPPPKSSAILDTLRVLEWDKVCDCVSSFAGTSLGRDATKAQLWSLDMSYEESKRLLGETAAAVEMMKCGVGGMDFSGFDAAMVKSAIERALRGFPVNGTEAIAVANLIQSAETLQINLKSSSKDDANSYGRFMPLAEVILELPVNRSVLNCINQVIDEDGSVKDSASLELKRLRGQVKALEKKLYHLMEKLVGLESDESSSSEINIVNGRWCLKVVSDNARKLEGLLLSSGTGFETMVEPLAAVPLNDELQNARSSATRAEDEVLSKLTDKMLAEVDDIQILLDTIIQLDVVIARANYSITYGGTFPELSLPEDKKGFLNSEVRDSSQFNLSSSKWKLYARGAYHPLLLQKHQENLQMAKKDVSASTSELRRLKLQGHVMISSDKMESTITSMKLRIAKMEEEHPVPVDFTVSTKTNVVVITGPNTGGKTISLKTIGLSALMAKTGLYVIASEPVQMPWFDAIFADIGDEQSLSQSLSTFSGHLKRISAFKLNSTKLSLVLLDEVGAGTNPLEGAALGMSMLESFADGGAHLTIATTHHGELKTLKYSNHLFENACMEFDEVNLMPTYKILWGVPGRSNAFNIAERIGICPRIIDNARQSYGTASAEINEIILDMETFKQDFEHHLREAQQKIKLTREYHRNLLVAEQRVNGHNRMLQTRKMQAVRDTASVARSLVRNKLREIREDRVKQIAQTMSGATCPSSVEGGDFPNDAEVCNESSLPNRIEVKNISPAPNIEKSNDTRTDIRKELPKVGDEVLVFSLGKKATVLKVDSSKEEVMVQANKMKLRLKFRDIELQRSQK